MAVENCGAPGYVTEKLLQAFRSGGIPIYWGAPDVDLDFNPRAFVDTRKFCSISEMVNEVRRLDLDRNAYMSMLNEPIFADGREPEHLSLAGFERWFSAIVEQGPQGAKRLDRGAARTRYEAVRRRTSTDPIYAFGRAIKKRFKLVDRT